MPARFTPDSLAALIKVLSSVHDRCLKMERSLLPELEKVSESYRASARNLVHYLGMRQYDLRDFQLELASYGLSSLGRVEANTLSGLDAVLALLYKLDGRPMARKLNVLPPVDFNTGPAFLAAHTQALLGPEPLGRKVRIMVTMPSEAATDYNAVRDLLKSGMDVMRINCAHDNAGAWESMAENLQRAKKEIGRPCKILMDLAGPKLRTGQIAHTPGILHWKPARNSRGIVTAPARIWLTADPNSAPANDLCVLPVDPEFVRKIHNGDTVTVKDTRGRWRSLKVIHKSKKGALATSDQSAFVEQGVAIRLHGKSAKVFNAKAGVLPVAEEPLVLRNGDTLILTDQTRLGGPATLDASSRKASPAHIPCTLPQVFPEVRAGERIAFDDGKIGGVVKRAGKKQLEIEITGAEPNGSKLRSDKGINLPDTSLTLPPLTEKDLQDLSFAVKHADMVGLSFVRRPGDVALLAKHIAKLGATGIGIVLKIENREAFENLPRILLSGLCTHSLGVMVARGDLAVEVGFERLAEVQEEMLWLCEAAHVPVVWATQVLENMAQTGKPSRAEVTDAAMSVRAECVMLNKGPHITQAVEFLDHVLHRMQRHHLKKRSMLRKLSVSQVMGAQAG